MFEILSVVKFGLGLITGAYAGAIVHAIRKDGNVSLSHNKRIPYRSEDRCVNTSSMSKEDIARIVDNITEYNKDFR